MKNFLKTALIILLISSTSSVFAQTDEQKALEKGREAIRLMDDGHFDESIKLLKEAAKLDPDNVNYPYETAYAYYSKGEYKTSIKILEKLLTHKDVSPEVYQLLGNSYDLTGNNAKAIATYEDGLKLFPDSGELYLEMCVIQIVKKDYNKALGYCETGIQVDPEFPSNYYWASKIYLSSNEEVWGMLYGEIFMNLERNSKRTSEISKSLYDTYKSEIKITSDTSYSVSFSKNATITIDDLSNPDQFKLPFGVGVYEPLLMISLINVESIDSYSLNTIRTSFLDGYFSAGHNETYPNVLFDYQKKVKEAGHFEAYNHWILMKGDEAGFKKWVGENKEKWDSFLTWFTENQMVVDQEHHFHSGQY